MRELCYKARELLIEEGNVVGVDAPVTVSTRCKEEAVVDWADEIIRRYAATFMGSSTISWSCFESAAMYQTPITCSWVSRGPADMAIAC